MGEKKTVFAGSLPIGGKHPISIQTMTNTPTEDVAATSLQIAQLAEAGAQLVRVSVYSQECAKAVRQLVDSSPVPLSADVHFDHLLAAVENGI